LRRLRFPVWSDIDPISPAAALGAHHARTKWGHFGFSRITRHIDQRDVPPAPDHRAGGFKQRV
jgi:hypothetical protein